MAGRDGATDERNGFLVVFEGIDGTGKSTQASLLQDFLETQGLEVVRSREPTQGPYGKMLRESATSGRRSPEEELELFMRDRREHVEQLIRPALRSGKAVIIDRYYLSTAAYQGARGLDPETILRQNEAFAPQPDIVLLLELNARDGRRRIHGRGDGDGDLFEEEAELSRVAEVFAALDRPYIHRIDGSGSIGEIHELVRGAVVSHPAFRRLRRAS